MSSYSANERLSASTWDRFLIVTGVAALVHGGLMAASVVLEWRHGNPPGLAADDLPELVAVVPAAVVLVGFIAVGRAIMATHKVPPVWTDVPGRLDSMAIESRTGEGNSLVSSYSWLFATIWLERIFGALAGGMGEDFGVILGVVASLFTLVSLVMSIWFARVLLRLGKAYPPARVLGWIELFCLGAWLVCRVVLLIGAGVARAGGRSGGHRGGS
jgi:hypothetical protein